MMSFELSVPEPATGGVVTIGNFDGVHRGHQAMLAEVRELADARSRPAVVVTFDPHPVTILKPALHLPRLSTIPIRTQLLKQHGADYVVVLPVTSELLNMTPRQFFHEVVVQRLKASAMVEGPDFCFGKDRAGNTDVLRQLCGHVQMELRVIEPVCAADGMISSTRIRQLLSDGKVRAANDLLGHAYTICGAVHRGSQRGRQLGFPTANLCGLEQLLPMDGVYAGRCRMEDRNYATAVSIGPNPTFGDDRRKVECHLVGFVGDLYGSQMTVDILGHVRPLRTFSSVDALTAQIAADVAACTALCDEAGQR
ncbi:MAG: bifunctional riboflavin kinase/FAD synthetase [Planctomycetaceae bacterium]